MEAVKFTFILVFLLTSCENLRSPEITIYELSVGETYVSFYMDIDFKDTPSPYDCGACISESHNPTVNDLSKKASKPRFDDPYMYVCGISNLTPNTTYYLRAWASSADGIVYSKEQKISTTKGTPILSTKEVTSISAFTAICGGNITHDGGLVVLSRGVCWKESFGNMSASATLEDNHSHDGSGIGSFTSEIIDLKCNGVRYVANAYATNSAGTAYGEGIFFVTSKGTPIITTSEPIENPDGSVTCGGVISDQGGATVTSCGVCLSTTLVLVTLENCDHYTNEGNKTGEFVSIIKGLPRLVIYTVRAYATNSFGTVYGNPEIFMLPP